MEVTETLKEGLKRSYLIKMSAQELSDKVDEKLAEAQPQVEMKGFRKGKVPMALLKKQFGKQVLGEAMQESVDGAMSKHFEDSGDRPAQQPDLKMTNEDWKEGDDLEFALDYEALPEVPETDFSKLSLTRMVVEASDEDVDEALSNLAESAQEFEARKEGEAAKDGDQVVIDFAGEVGGEAFEGGSAEDYPLVLGSNSFIPGFEEQLIGAKAGEDKEVKVDFPDDYGAENLAGKAAVFKCKIKEVKAPVASKIDDELAKKFGAESLDDLKTQVSERLKSEYSGASRLVLKRELMDALDKEATFDLPDVLVDTEAKQIAHQLWHEENPDVQGHDHPEIEATDEHKKLAVRRVKLGLLLAEVGQVQKITVTDAEMQQAIMAQMRNYPGQEKQFLEFIQKNDAMQQQLRAPIFEDKVIDYIVELADVTDKTVDKETLQKAVEALDE